MRAIFHGLCGIFLLGLALASTAADVTLFYGGYSDAAGTPLWRTRFGAFTGDASTIRVVPDGRAFQAEAQLAGLVGANFEYAADVTVALGAEPHLQFRIADEGRYGIRLRVCTPGAPKCITGIALYEFFVPQIGTPCTNSAPDGYTHCANWTEDSQSFNIVREVPLALPLAVSTHRVLVRARGSVVDVTVDGADVMRDIPAARFAVGRFGVFAFGAPGALGEVSFSNIRAGADPLDAANFALLYSTPGYEAGGTKRALIRTLNDLPDSIDLAPQSRFTVAGPNGQAVLPGGGRLTRLPGKTFGMQLWEADFSSITKEGTYTLTANIIAAGTGKVVTLRSAPFEIRQQLVSTTLLKPMSLANAEARRGADEDFWRNWISESGAWHVGVDGAFIADRADAGAGHVLTRVFNIDNQSLLKEGVRTTDFRFVGRITIVSGCDAQMRFEDVSGEWWSVTLQAGDAGGCTYRSGAGAVRLSREGPGGFVAVVAAEFDVARPFRIGHPYDLEILVKDDRIDVFVDSAQGASVDRDDTPFLSYAGLTPRSGRFGLKAWAATARFEDMQVWKHGVKFEPLPPGSTRIPTFRNDVQLFPGYVACQFAPRNCVNEKGEFNTAVCRKPYDIAEEEAACRPVFGQLHGFHDSSSQVAEATSHGSFLSGLMHIWKVRASGFAQSERESLRRAIVANVLYLEMLYQEGGRTGQFAHSEMGRVAVDGNIGPWNTEIALYALSDFADAGVFVDRALARQACLHGVRAAAWLWPTLEQTNPFSASVVYARLARCAARENSSAGPELFPLAYEVLADLWSESVLNILADAGQLRDINRDTGRVIPWLEGVYELARSSPQAHAKFQGRLNAIASRLVSHLTLDHFCNESSLSETRCPPNGFNVLPQASGSAGIPKANWVDMQSVPRVDRYVAGVLDFVHFYNVQGHFPTAATDAVLLARMTGNPGLERIATGNLYWALGLNPGIPAAKALAPASYAGGSAWQGTSFIYRHSAPSARAQDGFRVESYTAKGWLDPWEGNGGSPLREAWRIDPQNRFQNPPLRSFMSFVNGHVLWDDQWDYWNTGEHGWLSGETFIIADGLFLKAALLLEDGLAGMPGDRANPYDTRRLAFFDTTHVDRAGTGWGFDDPDASWTGPAFASRAVHEFCVGKGFPGGRFTGHHIDERNGALCVPQTARVFDATVAEVTATGWDFTNIDTALWAQVARAATGYCTTRGYEGGFFTGHQLNGLRGVVCVGRDAGRWFDSTNQDLYNSGEGFVDINTVPWAKAARAATNICLGKGYGGGFFTGHQLNGLHGVVCLAT